MDDDQPPPLPPKQKGSNGTHPYSPEETARALEQEKDAYSRMKKMNERKHSFNAHGSSNGRPLASTSLQFPSRTQYNSANISGTKSASSSPRLEHSNKCFDKPAPEIDLMSFDNINQTNKDILDLYRNSSALTLYGTNFPAFNNDFLATSRNFSRTTINSANFNANTPTIPSSLSLLSSNAVSNAQGNHRVVANAFSLPGKFYAASNQTSLGSTNCFNSPTTPSNWSQNQFINKGNMNNPSDAKNRNVSSTYTYTPNIPFPACDNTNNAKVSSSIVSAPSKIKAPPLSNAKKQSSNSLDLIDLGASSKEDNKNVDVDSLLSYFDPLAVAQKEIPLTVNASSLNNGVETRLSSEAMAMLSMKSNCARAPDETSSYYEQVDPFEYMRSTASCRSDPINDAYDGLRSPTSVPGDAFDNPPPLPPRTVSEPSEPVTMRNPTVKSRRSNEKRFNTVIEDKFGTGVIPIKKIDKLKVDSEVIDFWETIKGIRETYQHSHKLGNPGLLHSSCFDQLLHADLSVKLQIYYSEKDPVCFTSDLSSTVEHIIFQALVSFELSAVNCSEFLLKVRGIEEYLWGCTALGESAYVQGCVKYDKDVLLTLVREEEISKPYLRTEADDEHLKNVNVEELMSAGAIDSLHYQRLAIGAEQFERELGKLHKSAFLLLDGTPLHELPSAVRSTSLVQVVKQICAVAGDVISLDIIQSIDFLVETCRIIQKSQGILDGEEAPSQDLSSCGGSMITGGVDYDTPQMKSQLLDALSRISGALTSFLSMYARAFRVDFTVSPVVDHTQEVLISNTVYDKMRVKVKALHRLSSSWRYDQYFVEAQLYHGSRSVGTVELSPQAKPEVSLRSYSYVPFDVKLDLGARINILPLESRVVLTVFGLRQLAQPDNENPKYIREEVGWTAVQCFSFDHKLIQGPHLLTLWPSDTDRRLPPAPHSSDHPQTHSCPLLCIEFTDYPGDVVFPEIIPLPPKPMNFNDLDVNTQQQLKDIVERDIFTFNRGDAEDREVLWEKRHYLQHEPAALAKVLLAAHSWDQSCLPDLHSMVLNWAPPAPSDALHLLLPSFADTVVRTKAIDWLRGLGSDQLLTYLPQLVQAVKHEAWDNNAVARMLLERAITCPRLAHHLYWLFNQCLPQQTSMSGVRDVVLDCRYRRRLQLITKTLLVICGSKLEKRLLSQEALLRSLYETAMHIKDVKDSQRMGILFEKLEHINEMLKSCQTSLPLSPALVVSGVEVRSCAYYNSFTVPLKLAFHSAEPNTEYINAIFKVGDDLRQDMLVIQMIRLMDKLWLEVGLDLKIVTFNVVPTGDKIGIIELVKGAETLRQIQTEFGVTGPFKDRPIAEWLAKQNPSALEYQRAVDNFTASCAGYCVATYILGICDRHNDNIMLKTTGHLFHIDFGKFLGDAQKFGNFKRDRTPFVLTADMAFVINGGVKPSEKFHFFVDLCCQAFNVIRNNGHLLLYLFALMASSGISGVSWNAVMFVQKALLQDHSAQEAGAFFARMIKDSLASKFTQVNFFIHNLAQLRFQNDPGSTDSADSPGLLLSFIPRTYNMQEEGEIEAVSVYNCQKRYNPNKYYVYIIRVDRKKQKEPTFLFRSYKEFSEFHQKLCSMFPYSPLHSLPRGLQVGRTEVKSVAERRKLDIELFLGTLFVDERVAQSDIVYTFFHPLLRDQEDADIHIGKMKNVKKDGISSSSSGQVSNVGRGQIKVSLQYERGQLLVMVQYARNLILLNGSQPSPYAKLYLLPDQLKKTKRKTRVHRKNCHPTFMEQITYRMSFDKVQERTLEISLWSEDRFSENSYLGSCYRPLTDLRTSGEEVCEWLSLENNIQTARSHDLT